MSTKIFDLINFSSRPTSSPISSLPVVIQSAHSRRNVRRPKTLEKFQVWISIELYFIRTDLTFRMKTKTSKFHHLRWEDDEKDEMLVVII